jgi:hypothetical protein
MPEAEPLGDLGPRPRTTLQAIRDESRREHKGELSHETDVERSG